MSEGPSHGLGQGLPVELEVAREMVQIEEVLDPAVPVAENHHRFKLLRYDDLERVDPHLRRGKGEQSGVGAGSGGRPHGVTQPHVDLEHQSGRAASCR